MGPASGGIARRAGRCRSFVDPQRVPAHECAGDLHAGAADDPVESLARYAHADRGLGMEQILDVGEAEGFQLIGGEDNLGEFVERDARRLEVVAGRMVGDAAGTEGTGHDGRGRGIRCLPGKVMGIRSLCQSSPKPMKIALPLTATEEFSTHYGASTKFIVFEVDPAQRTVHRRLMVVPQASGPCEWPRFLRAAGVDLVLAGGMGRGARQHMAEHGVQVLAGVPAATPDELVTAWLEGKLVAGENACDGSGAGVHHHDHHHGSGDHHAHGGCGCSH